MAQGDVVTIAPTSLTNGSLYNIQPGSGVEWTIHNIVFGGAVEVYKTDSLTGVNAIKWATSNANGGFMNTFLHCTNTVWYQIKNVSGGTIYVSYDGTQSK